MVTAHVIVDLQIGFLKKADHEFSRKIIRNVCNYIKENPGNYIVLEYISSDREFGTTHYRIISTLKEYNRSFTVSHKTTNDGSAEVIDIAKSDDMLMHFNVLGVNKDYCVGETVNSLRFKYGAKVKTIDDCVGCCWTSVIG